MADSAEHKPKIRRRRSTRARLPLPDTIDPLDIAVKEIAEGSEPGGNSAALHLVQKQSRLIDAELRFVTVQTISQKVGLAFKAAALALALLLLVIAGSILWRAASKPHAVVQPFATPPSLEQRGITGTTLAAGLLDHLNDIGERTSSRRKASSYAGGWAENMRVEVPSTGVSLGELVSLARQWTGNETVISGELLQRGEELVLAARINGKPARRYTGTEAELEQLLRSAAAGIYEDSQPYRHAVYLMRLGRFEEATAAFERIHRLGDPLDQKWARSILADHALGAQNPDRADALTGSVLAGAPWFSYALENRASAAAMRGHSEQALQYRLDAARALDSRKWREIVNNRGLAMHKHLNKANIALLRGDYRTAITETNRAAYVNLYDFAELAPVALAGMHVRLHEPGQAMAMLGSLSPEARAGADGYYDAGLLLEDSLAESGEWAEYRQALRKLDALLAEYDAPLLRATLVWPRLAIAEARTGNHRAAALLVNRTPSDCYRCVLARAEVASLAQLQREAETWFSRAVTLGPSLPQAHLEWGKTLLAQKRFEQAEVKFRQANMLGPEWADPLRYWGDSLLRQGRAAAAAERYKLAAERAPRWGALHLNWAVAEWLSGRDRQAGERLQAAAKMELSPHERSHLQAIRPVLEKPRRPLT